MMKWTALTVLAVIFYEINGQCLTANDNKIPQQDAKRNLYSGEQEFSLNMLRAVNQLGSDENIFFSPYSTYHALLLGYFIAGGQTETFLRKTLKLDPNMDKADIMNAYKLDKFQTRLIASTNSSYEFTNANKIYVERSVEVRDCINEVFKDEFDRADFKTRPDESRQAINSWVEDQTHNMIKDLLPSGAIDYQTNLVLVNAAYFKGNWKYEFNTSNTKEELFYISPTKQTIVDMMYMEGVLSHDVSDVLDAHILELPYKGEAISMYILLPPFLKEDGVANTLKKLTPERFQQMIRNHKTVLGKTVYLSLPKFSLEHTIELTPILESLGVGNLFQSDSDFSLLSNKQKLSLGAGIHKARIDVDERGSQAAAATALFSFRMMGDEEPAPVSFKCNRPFIFLLYNKRTQTILFIGVYRKSS